MGAPNFWKTFGEALTLSAERRGVLAYIPWFMILTIGAGAVTAWLSIFRDITISNADAVASLAAMMVAAGFFGAVSVGCMNQIFTTLNDSNFSSYLQSIRAFDQFLAWPQIVLLIQMTYIFACAIGIIGICVLDNDASRMTTLCIFGFLTLYITTKTWGLVDLLRLLAWHRQDYAEQLAAAIKDQNAS